MINGAVSRRDLQCSRASRGNRCKSCDVPGTEITDFTNLKAGEMRGCNLEDEVRKFDQEAKNDERCLRERGLTVLQGAVIVDRSVS